MTWCYLWFPLHHIFPEAHHLLIIHPHAWRKCSWTDASIQVFQWEKWFYQLHLILPRKGNWLRARDPAAVIGHKQAAQQVEEATTKAEAAQKRLRVEELEVQLERFTQMGMPSLAWLWGMAGGEDELLWAQVDIACCQCQEQALPCKLWPWQCSVSRSWWWVWRPGWLRCETTWAVTPPHTHWQCTTVWDFSTHNEGQKEQRKTLTRQNHKHGLLIQRDKLI